MTKLCIDCRYHIANEQWKTIPGDGLYVSMKIPMPDRHVCVLFVDLVAGAPKLCKEVRAVLAECGPEGRGWEAKPSFIPCDKYGNPT